MSLLTLPNELTAEIFLHCLVYVDWIPGGYFVWPSPQAAPLVLSQVCQRWRSIAFGTTALWSSVYTKLHKRFDNPQIDPELWSWLQRAGTRSLNLALHNVTLPGLARLLYACPKTTYLHISDMCGPSYYSSFPISNTTMIPVVGARRLVLAGEATEERDWCTLVDHFITPKLEEFTCELAIPLESLCAFVIRSACTESLTRLCIATDGASAELFNLFTTVSSLRSLRMDDTAWSQGSSDPPALLHLRRSNILPQLQDLDLLSKLRSSDFPHLLEILQQRQQRLRRVRVDLLHDFVKYYGRMVHCSLLPFEGHSAQSSPFPGSGIRAGLKVLIMEGVDLTLVTHERAIWPRPWRDVHCNGEQKKDEAWWDSHFLWSLPIHTTDEDTEA